MRRGRRRCRLCALGALAAWGLVVGGVPDVHAAATAPGTAPPAPPVEAEQPTGLPDRIPWSELTLAPIETWGNVALDLRYRGGAGALATTDTAALSALGRFASYVWQPWFLRVQGSLGGIVVRDGRNDQGGSATSLNGVGDLELALVPYSRFPFTLFLGVTDTRASGSAVDLDYRDHRLRLSQQYQHEQRSERYSFSYEQSTLRSDQAGGALPGGAPFATSAAGASTTDRLRVLRAGWARTWVGQSVEVDASISRNVAQQGRLQRATAYDLAMLRHVYEPTPSLNVATVASFTRNENEFSESGSDSTLGFGNTFMQVSSFGSYRPDEGEPLHVAGHPLQFTGTVRAFRATQQAGSAADDSGGGAATSLGVTYELRRDLQAYATTQAFTFNGAARQRGISQSVGLNYVPEPLPIGDFRYAWTASTSGLLAATSDERLPRFAGIQGAFSHSLLRTLPGSGMGSLSATLSQGVSGRTGTAEVSERSLSHSLSLFWNAEGDETRQGFIGLTLSDVRRRGLTDGSFQLANVQATLQQGLSRRSHFSGSVTVQATRSDEVAQPFAPNPPPLPDDEQGKWRVTAGGNLTYTHTAAFGVPRLQFQSILQADTYALQRREQGDPDAPLRQVNWSFENRLDWAIGRLTASLVGRVAELEQRGRQWQVYFRVQRNFGAL